MKRQISKKLDPTKLYRLRVLAGHHSWNEGSDDNPQLVTAYQGEEFETNIPYHEMAFNQQGSIKFQLMSTMQDDTEESLAQMEREIAARREKLKAKKEGTPQPAVTVRNLEDMTMVELQELAEANGINISGVNGKKNIIKVIEEATVAA